MSNPIDIVERLHSLKVLLGIDSPEVRGWAPVVQREAQKVVNDAIAALAAQAPQPVAWLVSGGRLFVDGAFTSKTEAEIAIDRRCDDSVLVPLYAAPGASPQPAGMTMDDSQIHRLMTQSGCGGTLTPAVRRFAQACAALGTEAERKRCAEIAAPERIPYSDDEWRVRCDVRDAILDA